VTGEAGRFEKLLAILERPGRTGTAPAGPRELRADMNDIGVPSVVFLSTRMRDTLIRVGGRGERELN